MSSVTRVASPVAGLPASPPASPTFLKERPLRSCGQAVADAEDEREDRLSAGQRSELGCALALFVADAWQPESELPPLVTMLGMSTIERLSDVEGRVAVVTGAASGLGLAMAKRFATDGMRLVMADVERDRLAEAVDSMKRDGHEVESVVVDVSRAEDLERLAEVTFATFGAAHVLCNNAGVVKSSRAWLLTGDDWSWVLGVDLWGVIHGVRAFVPRMIAQGEAGHVVNTASMAGLLPMPNLAAYAVAKSGVVALSESLYLDLEAEGVPIGVSVLCPGWIQTRITDSGRNRPEALGAAAPPPTRRSTEGVTAELDADDVAAQVVDAIRTGRFWILTHPRYREVIQSRAAGIGSDVRPTAAPVW
jgi:NAD(P)-dependent dehydrogenase (short-subunit alcohol dehydrogenase family)